MRAVVHAVLLSLFAALSLAPADATAQDEPPVAADRSAIADVISRQLDAFQRDAGAEAFSYASPAIQRLFRDPETFMSMVRSGYQPVYRPQAVEFIDLVATPRGPVQRVLFVGPDGEPVMALYFMQQQPDGSWRINGVTLEEPSGTTA